jgi:hypothetical protein
MSGGSMAYQREYLYCGKNMAAIKIKFCKLVWCIDTGRDAPALDADNAILQLAIRLAVG